MPAILSPLSAFGLNDLEKVAGVLCEENDNLKNPRHLFVGLRQQLQRIMIEAEAAQSANHHLRFTNAAVDLANSSPRAAIHLHFWSFRGWALRGGGNRLKRGGKPTSAWWVFDAIVGVREGGGSEPMLREN